MKVFIILFATLVCFAAANIATYDQPEPIDILADEVFANEIDEFDEIEARGIFSGFFKILITALRTLKGINCSIKQVAAINTATEDFINNIHSCGTDAVNTFKNVLTGAQSVITTSNNIIHLNQKVCNNDESKNGKQRTPFSCFIKLLREFLKLRNQIKKTLKAINKVPKIPGDTAVCTNNAATKLTDIFNAFPSNIKTCSKLTS